MNCLIICGDHPRNYFFVKNLLQIEYLKITNVLLYKRENIFPSAPPDISSNLKKLWSTHFEKRNFCENNCFNFNLKEYLEDKIIKINSTKDILEKDLVRKIKKENIDICFISGIPILSKDLIDFLPTFTINLHLGLIPYYKGSITMFWPFLFLEPTMAGTTYHIIDKWVDTGEILHNNVPLLERGDGIHDVSTKAVVAAAKDIKKITDHVLQRINDKKLPVKDPTLRFKGKLFCKADWKPEMLEIIYDHYDDKIVDLYLDGKIKSRLPKLKKL